MNSSNNFEELKVIAKKYLAARQLFLKESSEFSELKGNDNIIGRIGELIAMQFLFDQKRGVIKNTNPVQKGYDLITNDGGKISVKVITAENKTGRTTKIRMPWTELILISLNDSYKVDRIGHIKYTDFQTAIEKGYKGEPYAHRKMLYDNNLFATYGTIYKDEFVLKYL